MGGPPAGVAALQPVRGGTAPARPTRTVPHTCFWLPLLGIVWSLPMGPLCPYLRLRVTQTRPASVCRACPYAALWPGHAPPHTHT